MDLQKTTDTRSNKATQKLFTPTQPVQSEWGTPSVVDRIDNASSIIDGMLNNGIWGGYYLLGQGLGEARILQENPIPFSFQEALYKAPPGFDEETKEEEMDVDLRHLEALLNDEELIESGLGDPEVQGLIEPQGAVVVEIREDVVLIEEQPAPPPVLDEENEAIPGDNPEVLLVEEIGSSDNTQHYIEQIINFRLRKSFREAISLCKTWAEDIEEGSASGDELWPQQVALLHAMFQEKEFALAQKCLNSWLSSRIDKRRNELQHVIDLLVANEYPLSAGHVILWAKEKKIVEPLEARLLYGAVIQKSDLRYAMTLWKAALTRFASCEQELCDIGRGLVNRCSGEKFTNLLDLVECVLAVISNGSLNAEMGMVLYEDALRQCFELNALEDYLTLVDKLKANLPDQYSQRLDKTGKEAVRLLLNMNIGNVDLFNRVLLIYPPLREGEESVWLEGVYDLFTSQQSPIKVWEFFRSGLDCLPEGIKAESFATMIQLAQRSPQEILWATIYEDYAAHASRFSESEQLYCLHALLKAAKEMPRSHLNVMQLSRLVDLWLQHTQTLQATSPEDAKSHEELILLGTNLLERLEHVFQKEMQLEDKDNLVASIIRLSETACELGISKPNTEVFEYIFSISMSKEAIRGIEALYQLMFSVSDELRAAFLLALCRVEDTEKLLELSERWPETYLWLGSPMLAFCRLTKISEQVVVAPETVNGEWFSILPLVELALLYGDTRQSSNKVARLLVPLYKWTLSQLTTNGGLDTGLLLAYKDQIIPACNHLPFKESLKLLSQGIGLLLEMVPNCIGRLEPIIESGKWWPISGWKSKLELLELKEEETRTTIIFQYTLLHTRLWVTHKKEELRGDVLKMAWPTICSILGAWAVGFRGKDAIYDRYCEALQIDISNLVHGSGLSQNEQRTLLTKMAFFQEVDIASLDNFPRLNTMKEQASWALSMKGSLAFRAYLIKRVLIFQSEVWKNLQNGGWDDSGQWMLKDTSLQLTKSLSTLISELLHKGQVKGLESGLILYFNLLVGQLETMTHHHRYKNNLIKLIVSHLNVCVTAFLSDENMNLNKHGWSIAHDAACSIVSTALYKTTMVLGANPHATKELQRKYCAKIFPIVGMLVGCLKEKNRFLEKRLKPPAFLLNLVITLGAVDRLYFKGGVSDKSRWDKFTDDLEIILEPTWCALA